MDEQNIRRFECEDYDVVAYDIHDKEIGRLEIKYEEDDYYRVYGIEVVPEWRRKGVGTSLVEKAMCCYGSFRLPPRGTAHIAMLGKHPDSDKYFTSEGQSFFQSCLEKGIIREEQFDCYIH